MVNLVLVHGRGQEFGIPIEIQRRLEEAVRWGLQRINAPYSATIPVSLAFYGDFWRPDTVELEGVVQPLPPTSLQRQVAADMLAAAGEPETILDENLEGVNWVTLNDFATFLDQHLGLGDLVVRHFLDDVESYFADAHLRELAIKRVVQAVDDSGSEVVLLGHSLGSVVAYDVLQERSDLPVLALITLGSPLGLPTVLRRLQAPSFPPRLQRWVNVINREDFVTGDVTLRDLYPSGDDRAVQDLEMEGRSPALFEPNAAHDGTVYLSSIVLANALRSIVDDASN
jgi:hypothetical protein